MINKVKFVLAGTALSLAAPFAHSQGKAFDSFFTAIKRDRASEVTRLLEQGMDPNAVDNDAQPAMMLAAREKSFAVLRVLMADKRADLNRLNPQGESPLMALAMHAEIAMMGELIAKGAEVNKTGWAPLHYAAAAGSVDAVKFLLENHAYIDAESPNKTTPVMMAARMKHVSAAEFLVEEGADPTVRNEAGLSAADYLIRIGETAKAQWMVDKAREFRRKYQQPTQPAAQK
jgi:uncharacterized protein